MGGVIISSLEGPHGSRVGPVQGVWSDARAARMFVKDFAAAAPIALRAGTRTAQEVEVA